MITAQERIIVALDFPSVSEARDMSNRLKGRVGVFKIGMELVYSGGLELARELVEGGDQVFLDLKLARYWSHRDAGHQSGCASWCQFFDGSCG